jgi:hypothetical protein
MRFALPWPTHSWRGITLALTAAAVLVACTTEAGSTAKKKRTPVDPGDDFFDDDVPAAEEGLSPTTNPDSGAFGASARPAAPKEAGPADAGPADAGPIPKVYCDGPLAAGDLVLDELLVASRSGSGDDGEWVEIRSTRDCWLKLKGLTVASPRGAATTNQAQIAEDYELDPHGTFVVADSTDPLKNHGLPGKVFAWDAADVLKNDGDVLKLELGATVIDTHTYPAFSNLTPGRSLAFPDDCAPGVRSDWTRWSLSFAEWKPTWKGTPNATNSDVACY